MWPEEVERIAVFLRGSGVEGRLEEVLDGAGPPVGQKLCAEAFDGEGGVVVALVPADRAVDLQKLAVVAGWPEVRPAPALAFPFEGARVLVEQTVVSSDAVWLEAGSPRHVLRLSPAQVARVTRAETADLLRES